MDFQPRDEFQSVSMEDLCKLKCVGIVNGCYKKNDCQLKFSPLSSRPGTRRAPSRQGCVLLPPLLIAKTTISHNIDKPNMIRSANGPLVEEIKEMFLLFDTVSVNHVRRSCNEVAHKLASDGCRNKLCNSWVDVPPGYVVNLLATKSVGS